MPGRRVVTAVRAWQRGGLEQRRHPSIELRRVDQVLVERRLAARDERRRGQAVWEQPLEKVVLSGRDPQNVISHAPGPAGRADPIRVRLERDADDANPAAPPVRGGLVERLHLGATGWTVARPEREDRRNVAHDVAQRDDTTVVPRDAKVEHGCR